MKDFSRRLGKFYISTDLVIENPTEVQKVLSEVVVVRCENIFHKGAFEYIGISNHFDLVKEGFEIPLYNLIVHQNGTVEFKKEDVY